MSRDFWFALLLWSGSAANFILLKFLFQLVFLLPFFLTIQGIIHLFFFDCYTTSDSACCSFYSWIVAAKHAYCVDYSGLSRYAYFLVKNKNDIIKDKNVKFVTLWLVFSRAFTFGNLASLWWTQCRPISRA